ncbi:MAG TPA: extracellular solute-binding protein [Mycobacteriales bacterium]|nr:extracellular solute-binding protein [Mycobacteriales bacterium]
MTTWDWWVTQAPWIENEIKLFEQKNPKIKIDRTVNATGAYDRLFNLAERSNNAPDLFQIITTTVPLNDQVKKGWLEPINSYADSSWIRQFPPYTFVEGSNVFDGKIYSAPLTEPSAGLQLFINNKVFKDAGLTNGDGSVAIPKTWDDLTRAADTITKKGGGKVYGFGFGNSTFAILPWWFDVLVRAAGSPGGSGGQDLRIGKYVYSTDRNYLDLFDLIMEWKGKGYFYPNSLSISDEIARAYFERGRFGMTVGGVWNQSEWTPHKFTDYTVVSLIGPEEERKGYFYSAPGGNWLAINALTKNKDAAWKWFSWWYSPAAGKRFVQDYNEDLSVFPQNNDPGKITFKPFSQYVGLQDLVRRGPQPWLKNPQQSHVVLNPVTPDFGAITTGVYSGQIKDVKSALSELDGRLQDSLDKGLKQAKAAGYKVDFSDFVFPDWDITKPYKWSIPEYPS